MHRPPGVWHGEDALFHGPVPLADHPTRLDQHEARHETHDHMPLGGVFGPGLTRLSGQQVLEEAEPLCHPMALVPGLKQPGALDRAGHREELKRLLTGLVPPAEPHLPSGATPSAPPPRATARGMPPLPPGPRVALPHLRACARASVFQGPRRGACARHAPGPLRRFRDVAPALRGAAPPSGPDHRGGARDAWFGTSRPARSAQGLGQGEWGVAAPPRAWGLGPTAGQGARDEALASAQAAQEEAPIAAGHGACARPAVPRAAEPAGLPVVADHGSLDEPAPWPATVGGGALILGGAPPGEEQLPAHAAQAFQPGAWGQSAQPPGGDMFVPAAEARACMAMVASKERGHPEADACAQPLLWGLEAACHLGAPRLGNIPGFAGLRAGLARVLGRSAVVLEALWGMESTAFSGWGLGGSVSFHGGHGALRRPVWGIWLGLQEPMSHLKCIGLMVCGGEKR
jgi:hypothetical protein